jgi:cytoplasmic iron level regulating protein YaaA (DUF328/UPF0246 family)
LKFIISPAKQMKTQQEILDCRGLPVLLEKTKILAEYLKSLSYPELKALLSCSDALTEQNFQRYQSMDLTRELTPAILSYDGIQYQYMAPQVFETSYFDYVQEHLRILSGFYGILRPLDGVVPYRLEMQAKLKTSFCKNLYDFWGDSIYQELTKDDPVILNLASAEYSRVIQKHLTPDIQWINFVFGEKIQEKIVEKGVYVKMARGEMVRFLAEQNASSPEAAKEFDRLNFQYSPEDSSPNTYVFLRRPARKQEAF